MKLAVRSLLRRRPGLAAATALSLALGFATLIVVLSCTTAVLWRPPPVPHPERMAAIYGHSQALGSLTSIAWPQLERLQALDAFESVAGFTRFELIWETPGNAEKLNIEMVTANYFDTVRPPLALGRAPREAGELLLGHDFWRGRLGASPAAVGTVINLSGERYVITGVAAAPFRGMLLDYMGNPKAWITLRSQNRLPFLRGTDLARSWVLNWFIGAARLRPGHTVEMARQSAAALERSFPPPPPGATLRESRVFSAERANFLPNARQSVERTMGLAILLASLLLLLGCLNAALFFASKALGETRQAAIEHALGAGLYRIGRRRFTEAALLCVAGLAVGGVLAAAAIRVLAAYPPPLARIVMKPVWDWRVWALAAGWTLAAVVIAGMIPAIIAMRARLAGLQSANAGATRSGHRVRSGLVALQVAVATVILASAGMILRTVARAHTLAPGFAPAGLVMAEVELYGLGVDSAKRSEMLRSVLSRLAERPEVEQAASAALMPLTVFRTMKHFRDATGATVPVFHNGVSAGYFATMRMPLARGAAFAPGAAGAGQAVVNEALARALEPRQGDVLGRSLDVLDERGAVSRRLTITGVARNALYHTLWQEQIPYFYSSSEAEPGGSPALIVRARSGSSDGAAWLALRDSIRQAVPNAVVSGPRTPASQLADLIREQSYLAVFFATIGAIALAIASGGLLAALQLMVTQRTREMGIRQALGATRRRIVRMILLHGMLVAAAGLALGLAAGIGAERLLRPLAPGTAPGDPWPLAAAVVALLIAALAAAAGPAVRAARIHPWAAIRHPE